MMRFRLFLAGVLTVLALAACTGTTANAPAPSAAGPIIQVSDPWSRPTGTAMSEGMPNMQPTAAGMQNMQPTAAGMAHGGMAGKNGAAYMLIRNTGGQSDRLVSASSDVAQTVELHTVINEGGVMQMRPVEGGIEIPAGGEVELKPGGFHVMLLGLNQDLTPGMTYNVTLTFEQAGTQQVTVTVRQP